MDINGAISRIRKEKGLTQKALSKKSGICQTTISQIEKGHVKPSEQTIEQIAKGLGVTHFRILFEGIEDADVPPSKLHLYNALQPTLKAIIKEL